MAKKDEVAVIESAAVPDYIKQGGNRGSEQVGMGDLTIPRLEVVQSLSPCRKKTDPAYIEGAEEGMLYNNVSREIYGTLVKVVPVTFKKEWLVWKDRKLGGGFRGAFSTQDEALEQIVFLTNEDPANNQGLEAQDTAQHLCLLVKPDGKVEEVVISMSRSKMKISRQWNSMVRLNGGDRFSRMYSVEGVPDQNDKGEDFYNLRISNIGFPSKEVYERAEKLYEEIASGSREFKVNTDEEPDGSGETSAEDVGF